MHWNKTWFFGEQVFFKIELFKNKFFFKLMLFKNMIFFKIWRVVKFLFQNLTRGNFFNSKSCFANLLLQIFAESLSKCCQQPTCWLLTWCKKVFYECVVCVCLTFGTIFLVVAIFGKLGSWWVWWRYHLHYQLFHTNLFGFQKMVSF